MNKLRILLTGGGGMVGRNLLEHSGIDEFDMIAPNSRQLDLRDYHAVQSYLKKYQPDMVIHAAGKVGGIHANMREPVSFLMDNLDMGRNIVWAAHQSGVKKLINLGSSCMFPCNYTEPLKEEMVLKGELESTNEGYALAKIVTARLCEYVMKENGDYQYKTLIPCNIYGRFDKFDPAHSHLLPAIIHKIHQAKLSGSSSVEIWGDGGAKREFMYAGDLANAIFQAINHFDTLPNYLNLGLGHDYTINEYYDAVAKVIGYKGNFVHDVSKPVGMARKLLDIEKQTVWGWQAKTSLQVGINKTYEFYLRDFCNEL